jgi:hypothetical protein
MSKRALGGFFLSAILSTACNGDSTVDAPPANFFVGRWACSDERTLNFTSPPGAGTLVTTEKSTLTITAADKVLTAGKETEGGSSCKVSFTSDGSTATLAEGQMCTSGDGVSITYKTGSATVSGSSLSSTFEFDASGNFRVDGGGTAPAMASGTQTSTCSRISSPPSGGATTTGGW